MFGLVWFGEVSGLVIYTECFKVLVRSGFLLGGRSIENCIIETHINFIEFILVKELVCKSPTSVPAEILFQ
ncbi:hypothetical protein BpHYR1_039610 [Brachionus plicatilis]|uniref:Uncharacterized protein n=1 Tax=Brachionus plicatilis TaxID=10195 RepID=A0A3M7PWM5_BRAPC|nr:hypothetical protein BpHYR1_039610 [Brachionus plicatilis]